jgi:orotidine-5'-phosphate decarboxylase
MLKAVVKSAKKIKNLKLLGVTVLTSISNSSIKKIGHTKSIKELVKKQAYLLKLAKLDGIVCAGYDVKFVKKIFKNMEIITPGIRLKGDSKGDQKRVMSLKKLLKMEHSLVMGRSLLKGILKIIFKNLIKN